MPRHNCLILSLVILLSMTGLLSATMTYWDNGANDGGIWSTPANWNPNTVPTGTIYAGIQIAAGPVIKTGDNITTYRIVLNGTNGTLTVNDGTLNTTNHIYLADVSGGTGILNMNGGAVNIAGTFYIARDGGSIAYLNLLGGTITTATLNIGGNGGTGAHINIEAGTLTFTTSASPVTTYISNGWINAYNGAGTLIIDTTTIPGKTILKALPQTAAAKPSPADNAQGISTTADLLWKTAPGAISHDVYFGTSQTDVANTDRLLGDFSGNKIMGFDDISIFAQYWLENPAGLNQFVDLNADDTVNFMDYSMAAPDWKNSANPVFKGNQDANTFDPGTLAEGTAYYWRVDEVNASEISYGPVWKFTTQGFANMKKGPYLIYPNNNTQMTVLWQADTTTTSSNIAWGTSTSYSLGNVNTTEYGTDHQHKYNITGLTPGTKYYYRVTLSGVPYTGSFTAAPASNATAVKLFMYGDTRSHPNIHNTCANRMIQLYTADPAVQTIALHAGDWVSGDGETQWTNEWFTGTSTTAQLAELQKNIPIAGCAGNHEGGSAPIWSKYMPQPYVANHYYSFDYGPIHIAVIDMYNGYTSGSTQYNWLVQDLSNSTKQWKMIIFHEPAWNAGGSHGNNTTSQATFQPLAQTYGAQICMAGHNHFYSRCAVPTSGSHIIQHITHGAGGADFYSITIPVGSQYVVSALANTPVVGKLEINGNILTHTAYNASTGATVDTVTIDRTTW